jgi:hypothetical protein
MRGSGRVRDRKGNNDWTKQKHADKTRRCELAGH